MPQAVLLQDFISVAGKSSSDAVIQGEDQWVDLGGYADVYFFVDTKQTSGSPSLSLETSPTRDDALFASMATFSLTGTGVTTSVVRYATATTPLRRWVRWKTSAAAPYRTTFRVWMVVTPG